MVGDSNHADPLDRASDLAARVVEEATGRQAEHHRKYMGKWAPTATGECACGCGEEVDPRRTALGYGLTLECAQRMERK